MLFRKPQPAPTDDPQATAARLAAEEVERQTKGRPTPTRKEAELARKERLKPPTSRKQAAAREREQRAKNRASMLAGDERMLMPRDQGPIRKSVRDFIDGRFNAGELFLPGAIFILVLGFVNRVEVQRFSLLLWFVLVIVIISDTVVMTIGLRRHLAREFPDTPTKGTTFYAVMRALQIRRLRVPKPAARIGDNRRKRAAAND